MQNLFQLLNGQTCLLIPPLKYQVNIYQTLYVINVQKTIGGRKCRAAPAIQGFIQRNHSFVASLKINVFLESQPEKLQRGEILFDEMLNYNILGLLENAVYTATKKKS